VEESWGELEFQSIKGEKETLYVAMRCSRCMLPNVSVSGEGAGVRDKVVPDTVLRPRDTFSGRITSHCCEFFLVSSSPARSLSHKMLHYTHVHLMNSQGESHVWNELGTKNFECVESSFYDQPMLLLTSFLASQSQ
jgi:hypothetical protein